MEHDNVSPICRAARDIGWKVVENETMTVCSVPDVQGYGALHLFRFSPGMVLFRTDLSLYAPQVLSSLAPFPVEERSFLFLFDADKDDAVSCLMPTSDASSSSVVLPAGHTVRMVGLAYTEQLLRFRLDQRYFGDSQKIVRTLQALPSRIDTEYVLSLFGQVARHTGQGESSFRFLSGIMERFLFYLTNNTHELCGSCPNCSGPHTEDRMGLCAVASYFLKYPAESLSVEQLARIACMSPTKLKKLFKQVYGDTLYGYLRSVRMHLAVSYLKDGMSVTDTAMAVGYRSVNRFSEAFRSVFGSYPGKMKQAYRKEAVGQS